MTTTPSTSAACAEVVYLGTARRTIAGGSETSSSR